MITAEKVGDRITVTISPLYIEVMKKIPGSRYTNGAWTVPLSWAACKQLRSEFGELLEVGPSLTQWAKNHIFELENIQLARTAEVDGISFLPNYLYPPQKQAVCWAYEAERGLLGSEPRTGKTLVMVEVLKLLGKDSLPVLVVCPNSVKYAWADEFNKWNSGLSVSVLTNGSVTQRKKQVESGGYDVLVVNWEALRTLSRQAPYGAINLTEKEKTDGPLNLVGFRTVIADEAHRAADPRAKQTRCWWQLAWGATYRYALTGTPLVNHPGDLFSVLHGLSPEEYPVRSTWVDRYCLTLQGQYGFEILGLDPKYMQEFYEIFDPRFLRHTQADMAPFRPEKLPPQIRWVEMGTKQASLYKKMKKEMIANVDDEVLVAGNPLVKSMRLSQFASAVPVVEDGEVKALNMPSCKIEALLELFDEEPDVPTVVFSPSRKLIELADRELNKKKIETVLITGEIDPQLRAANISHFQCGIVSVVLATTGAGAEGITLSKARRVVFLGLPFSLVQWLQARERSEALDKTSPTDIVVILTKDTVDEQIIPILEGKELRLQEVCRDSLV